MLVREGSPEVFGIRPKRVLNRLRKSCKVDASTPPTEALCIGKVVDGWNRDLPPSRDPPAAEEKYQGRQSLLPVNDKHHWGSVGDIHERLRKGNLRRESVGWFPEDDDADWDAALN
jgi:hypothetical protein